MGRLLSTEGEKENTGNLCLLIGLIRKVNFSPVFVIESCFTTWSKASIEVRLLSSHRDREIGLLSSLIFAYQRDGSQIWRKTVLGCKTDKLLKKFACQRDRERICSYKFFEVNAPRKGISKAYSQE